MTHSKHASKFLLITGIGLVMAACAPASEETASDNNSAITDDTARRQLSPEAEFLAKFDVADVGLGIASWSIVSVPAGTKVGDTATRAPGFMAFAVDTTDNVKYGVFYEEESTKISYFAYEIDGKSSPLTESIVKQISRAMSDLRQVANDTCNDNLTKAAIGAGAAVALGVLAWAALSGTVIFATATTTLKLGQVVGTNLAVGATSGVASVGVAAKTVIDAVSTMKNECAAARGIR